MSTKATIDGRAILGATPFVWEFRPGVSPSTAVADLAPDDAEALVKGGLVPLRLEIGDGGDTVKVEAVYAIQRLPGANEKLARVLLADRRWFWSRTAIKQTFNLRRHIGVKRLTSRGSPPVVAPVVDDVQYAPWSLDGGVAWTAERAVREIMHRVLSVSEGSEAKNGGQSAPFSFEGSKSLQSVPFEGLVLFDSGDQAISRLLAYLPDFGVTVDPDGTVRVYSRVSTDESKVLDSLGAEKVGGGHIELVELGRIRPREIHVLFVPEAELRLDFTERYTGETGSPPEQDGLYMENVLPVPDFDLGDWVQGTWVTIAQATGAWGAAPGIGTLTSERIRRAMCPFMDLWSPLRLAGQFDPDADWGHRISALIGNWRRTFRINRRWMDRIQKLNAYAVATLDQETGTRGPALVWSDWCALPTQRSMLADILGNRDIAYAINFDGYPDDGLIASARSSPCKVSIADHDQGIIRLDWVMDELRLREMLIPGQISNNPSPRFDGETIAFNALVRTFGAAKAPQMASGYKCIVLLSAVPAVPNDESQLYRVVVKPSEIADVSGFGPSGFDGPVMEVLVGPGIETARIAWLDSRADDIKRLFGITPGKPDVSDLVINDLDGHGGQAGSLNEIAKAAAARVWAGLCDRQQGQARFDALAAPLKGLIDKMTIEVQPSGERATTVETGSRAPQISLFSFLPADVRNFVMKLAQAGK